VNVLSEYPYGVPPKRPYHRRNVIGKDRNNYDIPAEPKHQPAEISSSLILMRTNGRPVLEIQRFCPQCGWMLSFHHPRGWECPNSLCSVQSILFGRGKRLIRKITFASVLPGEGKTDDDVFK
jgi:ribosomal protein S27AE